MCANEPAELVTGLVPPRRVVVLVEEVHVERVVQEDGLVSGLAEHQAEWVTTRGTQLSVKGAAHGDQGDAR